MAGRKVIEAGEFLTADLCGVYNRYHSNVMRGFYLGEPTKEMLSQYEKAAGVFDLFRNDVKAGMTVREVNALIRKYLQDVGLADGAGWVLGYELGLSLPPDWVGNFYFHYQDEKYLDRVFEENMVTNLESLFNTWLIDTLVYERDGARILSNVPLEMFVV
jgi:Xaa-Pro aminopeptidase